MRSCRDAATPVMTTRTTLLAASAIADASTTSDHFVVCRPRTRSSCYDAQADAARARTLCAPRTHRPRAASGTAPCVALPRTLSAGNDFAVRAAVARAHDTPRECRLACAIGHGRRARHPDSTGELVVRTRDGLNTRWPEHAGRKPPEPGARDEVIDELDTTVRECILVLDAKRAKLEIEGDIYLSTGTLMFMIKMLKKSYLCRVIMRLSPTPYTLNMSKISCMSASETRAPARLGVTFISTTAARQSTRSELLIYVADDFETADAFAYDILYSRSFRRRSRRLPASTSHEL